MLSTSPARASIWGAAPPASDRGVRSCASFVLTTMLFASAYGCLVIMVGPAMPLPLFHPWYHWLVWNAAPPALLVTAIWASHRMRQLRRMDEMRRREVDPAMLLARGLEVPYRTPPGPSGPELLCPALVVLGLATLPVWLGLPLALLWLGTGLGFWRLLAWRLPR